MTDPKDVARRLVEAYNAKALDAVAGLYHEDAVYWDPLHRDGVRGREAIRQLLAELFASFPDERMAIRTLAGDDVYAVAELVTTAGDPAFRLDLTEVYETRGGQLVGCRAYFDPEQLPRA